MADLDDNLRALAEQFEPGEPLSRLELDQRARRVRRRRRASQTGIAALVTVTVIAIAVVAGSMGDRKRTQVQVIPSTTVPTSNDGVGSVALPSKYLFTEISTTTDGLVLSGEVAGSTSTCVSTAVNAQTLGLGQARPHDCDVLLAAGNVEVMNKWLSTNEDNVEVSVVRVDPETGERSDGQVVMTYTHASDTAAVVAAEGPWVWVYDVATTRGPELLQISASTGEVVATVEMPQLFRPIMAATDDGIWLGPSITGTGPAALYRVATGSTTPTVVIPGHDSVCWLVGSRHDVWAGTGPTCLHQTIQRFHGSDPKPVFSVPERGYDPTSVVGNEADGLWTMQWAPPVGTAVDTAPRPQNVVRIDPITGAERITTTLPPLAVPTSASGGLQRGQAGLLDGSMYLLEPPFRQGDYLGYSRLVRVRLGSASADAVDDNPSTVTTSGCSSTGFSPPRWPKSGAVTSAAKADAPATARQLVATELGIADVAAVGEMNVTAAGCTVNVRVGNLQGVVVFIEMPGHRYAVEGFNLGAITGASMQVAGRRVELFYDPDCGVCTSWEMHIRYGDAAISVGPTPTSHMTAALSEDPRVSGTYVLVSRLADGSIRSAHALTVPAGDFAAS